MTITKQELKYLFYAAGFAILFFIFLLPQIILKQIDQSSPYLQFFLFTIGIFIFLQIILKGFSGYVNGPNFKKAFGLICLFIAIDIFMPSYSVSINGKLLTGPLLSFSSSDYVAGYLAQGIGLSGISVFLFTYLLVPILLLYVAAILIPNFLKSL